MRLGRHVKYWGRNAFVWTGISLACMLGFWLLNELGNAQYMQGGGLGASFLVYLAIAGLFVSMISILSAFQTEIPLLISMNVTRKAAVWGLAAGHAATVLLHIFLGILIWCIFGIWEMEIIIFISSLLVSVLLGFGGFGMLFGAIALRWGKIGSIIMAVAILVMTISIAVFIAMQGGSISLQYISLEAMMEHNFWPLALVMAAFYLFTGAAAFMLTRKIEVRV